MPLLSVSPLGEGVYKAGVPLGQLPMERNGIPRLRQIPVDHTGTVNTGLPT